MADADCSLPLTCDLRVRSHFDQAVLRQPAAQSRVDDACGGYELGAPIVRMEPILAVHASLSGGGLLPSIADLPIHHS